MIGSRWLVLALAVSLLLWATIALAVWAAVRAVGPWPIVLAALGAVVLVASALAVKLPRMLTPPACRHEVDVDGVAAAEAELEAARERDRVVVERVAGDEAEPELEPDPVVWGPWEWHDDLARRRQ